MQTILFKRLLFSIILFPRTTILFIELIRINVYDHKFLGIWKFIIGNNYDILWRKATIAIDFVSGSKWDVDCWSFFGNHLIEGWLCPPYFALFGRVGSVFVSSILDKKHKKTDSRPIPRYLPKITGTCFSNLYRAISQHDFYQSGGPGGLCK